MPENIRAEIVAKRRARVAVLGYSEGADVPRLRETPIVPFLAGDGLICEVKRRSPSKGDIAPGLDAVAQAGVYIRAGARNLSVLTEPEGFGGSLEDLMRVKKAFPGTAVLRKDFLFDTHDIDIAWRAGADAVLLIAGMLDKECLHLLYRYAKSLGLEVLLEIHDREDLHKAAGLAPNLVGINSRDLVSFRIDPLLPVKVKAGITWGARVVYESGINHPEQATFAASAGFSGLLVGESVVRNPDLAGQLRDAMHRARPTRFWSEIGRHLWAERKRPLVKICGLAREDDARLAADLGADLLGFVFWDGSPRHADPALLRTILDIETPKIGVVVNPAGAKGLDPHVRGLLEDGLLDAVQFHGDESPDDCAGLWPTYYKALRPAGVEGLHHAETYRCPRLLLDAAGPASGGTGMRVGVDILENWRHPLWLAGGVTPDNAARIAAERKPELLDIASGVEESPGVKSRDRMRRLFAELGG